MQCFMHSILNIFILYYCILNFAGGVNAAGEQDTLVGIQGKNFVVLGADKAFSRSIVVMRQDFKKLRQIDSNKAMAISGDQSSTELFTQIVTRNLCLENLESLGPISTKAAAHFARHEISTALRKQPYGVSCLIAGFDQSCQTAGSEMLSSVDEGVPALFWLDQFGSLQRVKHAAHGYASNLILSLLDRECTEGMELEEAILIVKKCFDELKSRYIINTSCGADIIIINESGVQMIDEDSVSGYRKLNGVEHT